MYVRVGVSVRVCECVRAGGFYLRVGFIKCPVSKDLILEITVTIKTTMIISSYCIITFHYFSSFVILFN